MDTPFSQTLRDAQAGEGRAFENLYGLLNQRVHSYAMAALSEDPVGVVNDVFTYAFRNLRNFEGPESRFNAWVFAIARSRVAHADGWSSGRTSDHGVRTGPDRTAPGPHPSVLRSLSKLPNDEREIILLRVVARLSLAEAAAVLSLPIGSVGVLQQQAIRTIAHIAASEGVPQ